MGGQHFAVMKQTQHGYQHYARKVTSSWSWSRSGRRHCSGSELTAYRHAFWGEGVTLFRDQRLAPEMPAMNEGLE